MCVTTDQHGFTARKRAKRTRTVVLVLGGVLTGLPLLAFVAVSLWIGFGVRSAAAEARAQYEGDRVEALMQYVQDTTHSFGQRNRAVWALGQLGDPRALPAVQPYFTGGPCDHSNALCQRELEKAIRLMEGDLNISAWVWRHGR